MTEKKTIIFIWPDDIKTKSSVFDLLRLMHWASSFFKLNYIVSVFFFNVQCVAENKVCFDIYNKLKGVA